MKIFFRISVMKFQKKIFSFQNECLFESLFSIFGNCNSFEDFSSEGATVVRSGVWVTRHKGRKELERFPNIKLMYYTFYFPNNFCACFTH